MGALLKRLVSDESGGEVVDYVLVLGLVVVACFLLVGTVGQQIVARWRAVTDLL